MITKYLILSAALFAIGAYGVIARRNLLIILMSIELMLNAVNIAFAAFARQAGGTAEHGHIFFLMVMAVAAAEVAVGLSIVIALFRTRRTVDTADVRELKG